MTRGQKPGIEGRIDVVADANERGDGMDRSRRAPVAEREHEAEAHRQARRRRRPWRWSRADPNPCHRGGFTCRRAAASVAGLHPDQPPASRRPRYTSGSEAGDDQEKLQDFIVDGARQSAEEDVDEHDGRRDHDADVEDPRRGSARDARRARRGCAAAGAAWPSRTSRCRTRTPS